MMSMAIWETSAEISGSAFLYMDTKEGYMLCLGADLKSLLLKHVLNPPNMVWNGKQMLGIVRTAEVVDGSARGDDVRV